MAEHEPFLRRWSRQKAAMRENPPTEAGAQDAPAAEREAENAVDLSALPDIDDLDAGSDFAAFMQPGVPEALRKQALRKLWTLDPAFSQLDGLVEYGEDYAAAYRAEHVVRTAWQIGKGMPDLKSDDAEDAETEEEVEAAEGDELPEGEPSGDTSPDSEEKTS